MEPSMKSNLIDRIFTVAMNIDVSKHAEAPCWGSDKKLLQFFLSEGRACYPDFRLKRILQALKKLAVSGQCVDISDEE